jgi:hypothetical protein
VAEVLPVSDAEFGLLKALVRHKVQFMLVGLSAAALQGAPVVTEDIDLWFEDLSDPKLSKALMSVGAAYVPPFGYNPPMLAGAGSEPFDVVLRMDGLDSFKREIRNAVSLTVGGLRLKVLSLERILASKRAANPPKDKLVIPVLVNSLKTGRALIEKKRPAGPRSKASRKR